MSTANVFTVLVAKGMQGRFTSEVTPMLNEVGARVTPACGNGEDVSPRAGDYMYVNAVPGAAGILEHATRDVTAGGKTHKATVERVWAPGV